MTQAAGQQAKGLAAPARRGQLRIYLGAAAGVGKTFAMLGEGHRRLSRGADVVAAFVETHGRRRTAEQLVGLEVIPRAAISYRGTTFEEMDVEAVLARRPQIAMVDELVLRTGDRRARAQRYFFSPAVMRTFSLFSGGGTGQLHPPGAANR